MFDIDLSYSSVKSAPRILYPLILKKLFKRNTGKDLNLFFPKTFNEKIQYLKLFDNKKIKTLLTDKIEAIKLIDGIVDKKHIKKIYGVYDNISQINLSELHESFYLKTNHGCKWQLKIDSKAYFLENFDEINKKVNAWLKINYAYANGLELQYENIKPKIFTEEVIAHPDYMFPIDVEIFCFDGIPRLALVRAIKEEFCYGINIYSVEDGLLPYLFNKPSEFRKIDVVPLPNFYDEMLEISKKITKGIKLARVDFFYTKDNFYFGEVTFTPYSGYSTMNDEHFEKLISQWFHV